MILELCLGEEIDPLNDEDFDTDDRQEFIIDKLEDLEAFTTMSPHIQFGIKKMLLADPDERPDYHRLHETFKFIGSEIGDSFSMHS